MFLAIVSVVAGAALGSAAQGLIDGSREITVAALTIFCLPAIGAAAVIIEIHRLVDDHTRTTQQAMRDLARQFGPRVELQPYVASARTTTMIEHCRAMFELKTDTVAKASNKRFPYKFILVDREPIVLRLRHFDENSETTLIWGDSIITDPQKGLIDVFLQLWKDIDNDPSTESVIAMHLNLDPAEYPATPGLSGGGPRGRPVQADERRRRRVRGTRGHPFVVQESAAGAKSVMSDWGVQLKGVRYS
ncbi:hypothetical protein GCM10023193_16890 [Planotetraspora kaengkrachanensis]|uniref:Uncharacterized protein n=2 Tax=Planotetraspora kaengkrachanensis TaxID=575193 RepID=A0A8J3PST6_9ACTN|nr:hypothetical protein Pka01_29610 [Planotetraspora kaengkrachanensis]